MLCSSSSATRRGRRQTWTDHGVGVLDRQEPPLQFRGVVLCGGRSRRMGRDKALIEIDGRAMASIAADALYAAGAASVHAVGGDAAALTRLGLPVIADRHPGEGPLGALLDAFDLPDVGGDVLMVLTCDLPFVDDSVVVPVVQALVARPDAAAAAPVLHGRRQLLSAAYRPALVLDTARQAFEDGQRAVRAGLRGLPVIEVLLDACLRWRLEDADTPQDLPAAPDIAWRFGDPDRPRG